MNEKIQDFINNRHQYKVDATYQRPADAWSKEDKQCLIDTIIRGEPIPLFFLNYISKENVYYIVDGQQRLSAITDFYDNNLRLSKKFSGGANHHKNFNGDDPVSDEIRNQFLDYKLSFKILEDYDDEKVRMIFSRLQRGKPLQLGERLNAKPGNIVFRMREIAAHPFMQCSIAVHKGRYGNYPDAARILFYEKHGAKQMGSTELYDFFDKNRGMLKTDKDYQRAISTLDYLAKSFPPSPGNYAYLEKHAWVLAVYTMVREMRLRYALRNKEQEIQEFAKLIHGKVYSEKWRGSDRDIQRLYENVRGGWSEKIISLRREILVKLFIKKNNPTELDAHRQISDEEKIAVYEDRGGRCERCSLEFKDHKDGQEYHHIERYADGGETSVENIEMLCVECHKKAHGKVASFDPISPGEEVEGEE